MPASLSGHPLLLLLLQVGLLLGVAIALGRALRPLGIPSVVGEIFAGVLFGPAVLGELSPSAWEWLFPRDQSQTHLLDGLGQIGVLLLVAITGLEIDFHTLRRRLPSVAGAGMGGLIVPLALGIGVGFLLPAQFRPASQSGTMFALYMGVAICVSALPVIAKTLYDLNLLHRPYGQLIILASALDDMFAWIMLAAVVAVASHGSASPFMAAAGGALAAALAISATVGRWLTRQIMRWTMRTGAETPSLAAAVVIVVLSSAALLATGLEPVLGAFLAGLMLRSALGSHHDAQWVRSLRAVVLSVFAPLYFTTAGLHLDLRQLDDSAAVLWGSILLTTAIVGKFVGAGLGARFSGLGTWESIAVGAGLNARGAVQIVFATVGLQAGIITQLAYTVIVLIAITTSLMAGPILRFAARRADVATQPARWTRERLPRAGQPNPPASTPARARSELLREGDPAA